ncbi:pyruvate kinase, partial [Candidatus Gracilibacteria bacterium]|nr:pyruvate kinase [Candidatus Gracilibacteria bacterium]
MRRTKIVSTIGPVSSSPEMLEKLALAGVNVFRLNFSHGNHESHLAVIKSIRALEKKLDKKFPIILDTKGPDIRTADVKEKIILKKGDT